MNLLRLVAVFSALALIVVAVARGAVTCHASTHPRAKGTDHIEHHGNTERRNA